MLQAANTELFNPVVHQAQNSECQNLLLPLQSQLKLVCGFLFFAPLALKGYIKSSNYILKGRVNWLTRGLGYFIVRLLMLILYLEGSFLRGAVYFFSGIFLAGYFNLRDNGQTPAGWLGWCCMNEWSGLNAFPSHVCNCSEKKVVFWRKMIL